MRSSPKPHEASLMGTIRAHQSRVDMWYRIKRTNLTPLAEGEVTLRPNVETMRTEAANAVQAVKDFIAQRKLRCIGEVEEGTGGTANAMCKENDAEYTVIRAFPDPDS